MFWRTLIGTLVFLLIYYLITNLTIFKNIDSLVIYIIPGFFGGLVTSCLNGKNRHITELLIGLFGVLVISFIFGISSMMEPTSDYGFASSLIILSVYGIPSIIGGIIGGFLGRLIRKSCEYRSID